ncbi:MAG: class I SAM-dependent methyltransferase [bacterium]
MKNNKVNTILTQTRNIYNTIAPDFSDTRGKWWQGFGGFHQYTKPGDKVLDLGCGNGRMADIFEGKNINYLGIDNSEELIKIAKERFKNKTWVSFEVGDATDTLPANNFDLVLILAVLHHIPTQQLRLKILTNTYNSLKPGGHLVISTWNLWQATDGKKNFRYFKHLFNYQQKIKHGIWNLSDALVPWKPLASKNLRYVHSFHQSELKKLLLQAGFEIDWISYEKKDGTKTDIFHGDNLMAVAVKK